MAAQGFTLFDTAIGRCGIAWGGRGVVGVQLPEGREAKTSARLRQRFPGAQEAAPPPPDVQRAIDNIAALLRGESCDLAGIALDMDGLPPFHRRVYEVARTIPPGATASYGELAERLGAPGAARAVGQALGSNPFAIVVPCHRVLAAGGRMGGFSANGGLTTKLRLLSIESAPAKAAPGFDAAAALDHLRARDPDLGRLIDAVGPCGLRLDRAPTLFLALAEAIVYQQLNGRAAATIFARVCALFPRASESPTARQVLRAPQSRLLAAGLSRAKLLSMRDLAQRVKSGELPSLAEAERMDDEALVERLSQVRGIGRWTVQMLLIFRLGRPDVLPVDDYGVRQGFALAFRKRGLPTPQQVARRGERWRPYRTVASWYLWRALERARK
jgi:methylated-DNA-[protein]-cysteine S-methyltransferase